MKNSTTYKFDAKAQRAMKLIEAGENLFIMGKAGTGKTTLLKEVIKQNKERKKNLIILAPTGVAAENADGMTIHHFFQLPLIPFLPEHTYPSQFNLKFGTIEIIKKLDIIIIDEISMVRCDILDEMDTILRHYKKNKKPFGGIQLVMFGDPYQLSPVVISDEWEDMNSHYQFAYFFCSRVLKHMKYKIVELTKIYRQEDKHFKDLLNNIRTANVNIQDLKALDSRFEPDYQQAVNDNVITLTTHLKKAKKCNTEMFSKLQGEEKIYQGSKNNWWTNFPAEYYLKLKVGARVMFIRNTEFYKNGTMGRVEKLYSNKIIVRKDSGELVDVQKAKWELLEYNYNEVTKKIEINVSGTYTQYPLKLAWAVSIHKSQGLTFDEVAIDAEKAFAYGQVYVALSRCRTLEGIHLISQIPFHNIIADEVVIEFLKCIDKEGNALFPENFNPIKYEENALELNISENKFNKILSGELRSYKHAIDETNKEQLFLHKNGKLCIHKTFSQIKQKWSIYDTNNGHCPFIKRQYNKVVFKCSKNGKRMEAEIDGYMEIYLTKNKNWAFKLRISKIESVK